MITENPGTPVRYCLQYRKQYSITCGQFPVIHKLTLKKISIKGYTEVSYTVCIQPSNKIVSVDEGAAVNDAILLAGIDSFSCTCRGAGTCGNCTVRVELSDTTSYTTSAFSTPVTGDCTIILLHHSASPVLLKADPAIVHIEKNDPDFFPFCRTITVAVPPPECGIDNSDFQRLQKAVSAKCGIEHLTCNRKILRRITDSVRREDGIISAVISGSGETGELHAVAPGAFSQMVFGIVCDIGTTTVSLCLVNLIDGAVTAATADYNAQVSRGVDITSRIGYACAPERSEELCDLLTNTINDCISSLLVTADIVEENIHVMAISGNTAMIHLFLGLRTDYMLDPPFVPTACTIPPLRAADCSLLINPEAVVMFVPGVDSRIGGDLVSGLLCTPLQSESANLYIDIGTSTELVLATNGKMYVSVCNDSRVFEGSGIHSGIRSAGGAIEAFHFDDKSGAIEYTVIDGGPPRGICGAGLLSLLDELQLSGALDSSGRFIATRFSDRIISIEGKNGLILADADTTEHNKPLIITETDIAALMQTIAAIRTEIKRLFHQTALGTADIDKVYIAGNLGTGIDVDAAIRTGLLPCISCERFIFLGNASLAGATRILLSRTGRNAVKEIISRIVCPETAG